MQGAEPCRARKSKNNAFIPHDVPRGREAIALTIQLTVEISVIRPPQLPKIAVLFFACRANQSLGCPAPLAKIFPFSATPNQFYNSRHPVPHTRGVSRSSRT